MVIITKTFKGQDGILREWVYDDEQQTIVYRGLAKDFHKKEDELSAEELLNQISEEEYQDYTP